jgi:hypothetical protein
LLIAPFKDIVLPVHTVVPFPASATAAVVVFTVIALLALVQPVVAFVDETKNVVVVVGETAIELVVPNKVPPTEAENQL